MSDEIRVLHVLSTLGVGGAEKRTVELNYAINTYGIIFDYLIISKDEEQYYEDYISSLGGMIHKISSPREIGIWEHICQLNHFFKYYPYNIVHAHTSYHSGIVLAISYFHGARLRIAHARTSSSLQISVKDRINSFIGKLLIKFFANKKLAISSDASKFLFGESTKTKIIPNAIDLKPFYKLSEESRLHIRESLGIAEGTIVYGHIGRFEQMKNHMFLIEIFKLIHDIQPNSVLVLVGDGQLRGQIEISAKQIGLLSFIYFVGIQSNVAAYLNIFDVFIFPSIYEGLGGAVIEAQTAGLPCIVSNNVPNEVAVTQLVQFLDLKNNPEEWAQAAINVCNNRSERYRILEVSQKGYDIKIQANNYAKIYTGKKYR